MKKQVPEKRLKILLKLLGLFKKGREYKMKKRHPHKNIPEGCFEEEQGANGFLWSCFSFNKEKT